MSNPCHCEYHYEEEEGEPAFSQPETKVQKDMYDLLAELFIADDPAEHDFAFIAIAGYIIKTPAAHAFLRNHAAIAAYLTRHTDELMNSRPHLLATCWELSSVLSRV